ncbi:hypothetical protein [Sphingomonas morindae]|uniref:DUF4148 domain-containing protein n=1 Tax=Sphingomonas morindae TaxID=1541170 RepID=A0ABY4X5N2_9SPHN|nr:hypothetical protein [Sphingomonas morindae]USI72209.1 hypothetical protein LHA26_12990 [Sphingomonas morindae]
MRTLTAFLFAGAALAATAASAQGPVNARQLNQERRIDAGVRSGKLTHREAARLKDQQASIKRYEDQLRAAHGGHLTERDKRLVHARQDAANAAILKKKNNRVRGRNHLKIG